MIGALGTWNDAPFSSQGQRGGFERDEMRKM